MMGKRMLKKSYWLAMPIVILALISLLFAVSASAESVEDDCVYYFYGKECEDCDKMSSYFMDLQQKYPDLKLIKFEVYHNTDNLKLLKDHFKAYNVNETVQAIPAVFIYESYFIGTTSISSFLEKRILDSKGAACPSLKEKEAVGISGKGAPFDVMKILSFSIVTGDAVKNIFRPGIIALALILLAILTTVKHREDVIKTGVFFIAGVYIAYPIFALGHLSWFYSSTLSYYFYKIIGVLGIIVGLLGIRAFLFGKRLLHNKLPKDSQGYLMLEQIKEILLSLPSVFALGLLSGLFTFFSVGKSFVLMRELFREGIMKWSVFSLMLYYSLVLVLILAAVLLLYSSIRDKIEQYRERYFSDKEKQLWHTHNLKILNLAARIIILIGGIVFLIV
ncbi:MAG: hypothetical protein AB1668_06115 [Nanoarchaeota archaeon]